MPHLSIVTPVYRAEDCLEELYRRLVSVLPGITQDFEIIMVEDCGGDRSWDIIRGLARRDPRVKGIQFSRNFGQHYGITAGLDHCDGDWVVVMDCDLQDRPEDIPLLYAKAQEGYDVVHAQRDRHRDALLKRWGSNLYFKLLEYFADVTYETPGNFRILSRKVVENFRRMREQLRYSTGLLHCMGFPTAYVAVQQASRHAGETTYTLGKLLKLGLDIIIAFSDKPLRLSVRLGFLIAFLAFGRSSTSLLQFDGSGIEGGGLSGSSLAGNVAALATRQLAGVAMGALVEEVESDLIDATAADVLNIRPADLPPGLSIGAVGTILRGTQIEIGKYLDRNTFFVMDIRPTLAIPGATLERRFGSSFRVRTSLETRFLPQRPSLTTGLRPQTQAVFGALLLWTRGW